MDERQVAIITGAAGGIGSAIARAFATQGLAVVATGRSPDTLAALAASLPDPGGIETVRIDVTDADAPQRIVAAALERFGRIDFVINNAAAGKWAPVHQTEDALLDEVLATSLRAPFRLCREAIPHMRAGSGFVFVGSTFGVMGGLDGGAYCAVKAGLIGLMQTMAAQYGVKGIRSNVVAPGVIRTAMTDDHWESDYFQRLNHEMTPFDRDGTAEDVANMVAFLCSAKGSYVNGQTIALDGGWSTTKYLRPEALFAQRVAQGG